MTASDRLGSGRFLESEQVPRDAVVSLHRLRTSDGATVDGVLRAVPGSRTVVSLMHPRQDLTHHGVVPHLLRRGVSVWTQGSRAVNNDVALIHERSLLDMAAGQRFLRDRFAQVVALGHSGGGPLAAFYCAQAALDPQDRLRAAPSGLPVDLAGTEMPVPDGVVLMAPHPGQAVILSRLIDPSVIDESDGFLANPSLDPYNEDNGFRSAPESSQYPESFILEYRDAQAARVARLDELAWELVERAGSRRERFRATGDPVDRRASLVPHLLTVYRTDADLRSVDLALDPNHRPYGSLMGRRPDLTNYGLFGFGRLSTPDAWLSTWSVNHSNAGLLQNAPSLTAPSLLIDFTGDQVCFPSDIAALRSAWGSDDLLFREVPSTHFGAALREGEESGYLLGAQIIADWLERRFEV